MGSRTKLDVNVRVRTAQDALEQHRTSLDGRYVGELARPSLADGPMRSLNEALHTLHRLAGWPSVRDLARGLGTGVASASRIHDAFTKDRLPKWGLVEMLVIELARSAPGLSVDDQIGRFHSLWQEAAISVSNYGPLVRSVARSNHADGQLIKKSWDVFVSYAWEDRDEIGEPLAAQLREAGLRVWFDGFELNLGDPIRQTIDQGIEGSTLGVVVLSPAFFAKSWTAYELNGLVTRGPADGQVVLPIWHNVGYEDVLRFNPSLADKISLSTDRASLEEIAREIVDVLKDATSRD